MPEAPALHLVIYSELLNHGGGRETWMGYFVPLLAARRRFRAIHVHHMTPSDPARALPATLRLEPGATPVTFHPSGVELYDPGRGPLHRYRRFTQATLRALHENTRAGDVLLALGAHGEAPPALLGWLLSRLRRRRLKLVLWFREAHHKAVAARHGRLAYTALRLLQHRLVARADRVLTNGQFAQEQYRRAYPRIAERILVNPNAVAFEDYAGLPLPPASAPTRRVGFVGNFIRDKGFPELLRAVVAYRAGGDPEDRLQVHAWGRWLNERDRVPFPAGLTVHDPVPNADMPGVLGSCDAMLFLNEPDVVGLSHALLEALAAGRLVIAWDVPCHRQILDAGNAVLVPAGDVAGLAAAWRRLAGDQLDVQGLAAAGREAARPFSQEAHVDRFLEAMDRLGDG